ncbi:MAG: zinc ribbon domain-containing protein, partial [Acidobacteriota bacterium]
MPPTCTCGARLPEDARFCHKCGKPQRDAPTMVDDAPVVVLPEPESRPSISPEQLAAASNAPPVPQPISLSNGSAVRAALPAGISALLFSAVLAPFALPLLIAGGIFTVFLYRRRTGQVLSILNGARLGWLTGLFLFLILLVALTAIV